jgi:hypothetical protein
LDPVSAQTTANSTPSGGIAISAAAVGAPPNDKIVVLTTGSQPDGGMLTLTVNNVKDMGGNVDWRQQREGFHQLFLHRP